MNSYYVEGTHASWIPLDLPEVCVSRFGRVVLGVSLTLERFLAGETPEIEVVDVSELPGMYGKFDVDIAL